MERLRLHTDNMDSSSDAANEALWLVLELLWVSSLAMGKNLIILVEGVAS